MRKHVPTFLPSDSTCTSNLPANEHFNPVQSSLKLWDCPRPTMTDVPKAYRVDDRFASRVSDG